MAPPQIVPDRHCHEHFYFSNGSLHLLVEDSLYCVHRSLFEIHANNFPVHGIDALFDNPYILKDVKQIDFDRLLACLYPHTSLIGEAKTTEEWTSILKLASKWGFESLRSSAIHKIKPILNTPVDMVAFGRQYDIPDVLLPGYATLCQTNIPLTYEEGLQLGMKDVVDIYRIRHELHGSGIMVVSLEEATAKVKAFISNEGRKDDAEVGATRQRNADFDDEQASVWTDVGSISSSRVPSTEDDAETAESMADTSLPLSKSTMTGTPTPGVESSGSVHRDRSPTMLSPSDAPGSQGGDSQSTLQDAPDMLELTNQGPQLLDELTMDNFNIVSVKILQWLNVNDSQTLYHATQLIVEKAINYHGQIDVCIHLCKEIVKKVRGQIQDTITKNSKCKVGTGVLLFRKYLGKVCQEKLKGVTASITVVDDEINLDQPLPEVRRRWLIKFISDLTSTITFSRSIVKKWIHTLLDAKNEEKLVTLSMLLDSAGPRWDIPKKLKGRMNSCFVEMTNIAQKTDNSRLRTLLQDVIERRNKGWVVNETVQQREDLTEKRMASCSSEGELTSEQPEDETVKTPKDGDQRSSKRDVMFVSPDEKQLVDDSSGQSAPSSPFTFSASSFIAPSAPVFTIGSVPTSSSDPPRRIKKLPARRGVANR